MEQWLRTFHGANQAFPAMEIAVKAALALAVGLLVGMEREWSNKDIGARTFAMASLLGTLGALLGLPLLLLGGGAVLILIVFANIRGLQAAQKLEATTSAALAIIFLLGVLVGQGHLFTPVCCAILVALLLAFKPQLRAFAGGLSQQEVRSALLLALLGFVIWPLLPDHFVDPWRLVQPREDWIIVVVIACLGFMNYVLLRVYGSKGVYLTAVLGGLVNSTATAAELVSRLAAIDLADLTVPAVLLTSTSMFLRNLVILAIFAGRAVAAAALPLIAMAAVAGFWINRERHVTPRVTERISLKLGSPVSLKRVAGFAAMFLLLQVCAAMGQRWIGDSGFQLVSVLGGLFSSAGTTAAAASLAMHGKVTASQAGLATVLTSMSSTMTNLPILLRNSRTKKAFRRVLFPSLLQVTAGAAVLILQAKF